MPEEAEKFPSLEALRTGWANPYQAWLGEDPARRQGNAVAKLPRSVPALFFIILLYSLTGELSGHAGRSVDAERLSLLGQVSPAVC